MGGGRLVPMCGAERSLTYLAVLLVPNRQLGGKMINRAVKLFIIRHFRNLSPTKTQSRGQHRQITGCLCTRVACKQKLCAPCNARVPATSSIKRRRSCTYRGQKLSGSTRARRSQREMACQRPQRPPPSFFVTHFPTQRAHPRARDYALALELINGTILVRYIVTFFPLTFPPFSHRLSHSAQGRACWFLQFHLFVFPIVFPFPFSRSFSLFPFPDRFPFSLFPFPFSPGGNFVFPWW